MIFINTNNSKDATSFNDLAVSAYLFYGCSYFHLFTPNYCLFSAWTKM